VKFYSISKERLQGHEFPFFLVTLELFFYLQRILVVMDYDNFMSVYKLRR